MTRVDIVIASIAAAFCAGVVYIFGGIDQLMICLFIMMGIDIISGIISAIVNKSLESRSLFKGIVRKFGMLCIVAVSVTLGHTYGFSWLRSCVIGFFIATEIMSIVENWGKCGLPIPNSIKSVLAQLNDRLNIKKD